MTMHIPTALRNHRWLVAYVAALLVIVVLFVAFLGPNVMGDTPSYIDSVGVLGSDIVPSGFVPNRIITSFVPLELMGLFSPIFYGDIYIGWFLTNLVLYLAACVVFYKLLRGMFSSDRAAFLGGLFLAGNYGFLVFGLNYLVDIGGWAFYTFSLYFLFRYSRSERVTDLLISAAMVGIGGLFKEYAFLGAVAIAVYLITKHIREPKRLIYSAAISAVLALLPSVILAVYVYQMFGYTYMDWFGFNAGYYSYASRLTEYVKALGSLVNLLALPFLAGAYALVRSWKGLEAARKAFLTSAFISFLPILFWPAITQRILTIVVPFVVIVASYAFAHTEKRWLWWLPVLALYILATFYMDSAILGAVELPL